MQNLAKQTKVIALTIDGTNYLLAAGTTDVNSTAVDTLGFHGVMFIGLIGTIAASGAVTFKVQYSDDNSSFTDVTGATHTVSADTDDNKSVVLEIYRPVHRYYRVATTRGDGGNSTINAMCAICFDARNADVTASTTNLATVSVSGG